MKISRFTRPALLSLALGSAVFASTAPDAELAALITKAEKGNAIAQYNLGLSYAEGRGVAADPIEAFVWLTFAQESGTRGRALEILTTRLSPAQLEIARARLDQRRTDLGFNPGVRETSAPAQPEPAPAETPADGELAQARLDKQQLSNELATAWKETDQLKAELERARADRSGLERMLTQAQQAALELGNQTDALNARVAELSARPDAPAYPDLRERTADLEAQVAALRDAPPAFPDLRGRVSELEQQLAANPHPAAPAYPDLRGRVDELESQLRTARESGANLETRADALAEARANVEKELQIIRSQLTRSQQQAGNAEEELRRTRARANELESALAEVRSASARPAAPAYPDLRERAADLEAQVAALRAAPAAYPDLRDRVSELEAQLAAAGARPAAPSYPDLRDRVAELEYQLAATQSPAAPAEGNNEDLARQLEKTKDKLSTALRGYSLLQQEQHELRARMERDHGSLSTERDELASRLATAEDSARNAQADVERLTASLGALERSTSQSSGELAAARALVQQLQGANAVLARENYELKARVARDPAAAAAATATGRTHTVGEGDTLSRISQRYYGTPARWTDIVNANRDQVGAQGAIRVGMVLRIP